jgi:aminopeptidase N
MPSLSRDEANTRADLLRVDEYLIDLDLTAAVDSATFLSTTTIRFGCRVPGGQTFVEVKGGRLEEVILNGVPLAAVVDDDRLTLPGLAAENELVVRAELTYSQTGEGLHRFVDPEDGSVYLYAQTFLDDASRVFACFDQPDLKAPVTMTVSAPLGWEVAANGAGTEVASGRWAFATTEPLATYFVSVIAGPYHVRRDVHDGIPLALYCRRGLASHLDKDVDEIFGITRACFDRYHELFGVRYPFVKYDQAFVPEFNAGAMENAGLVTFRDEFVFRSAVSDVEREQRAETIAHEMAHMWFGDLVTMRWWDDLWLNESFAEYMAFRVVSEVTRFTQCWTSFIVGRKGWGYAADQRPSTHPVAPESLPDAGLALLNFDGISYAKGAAVLRQLDIWLGDEVFLAGLRAHFAAHAFGNATLDDFLNTLSTTSGRDVRAWAEVWLRRPQVNTLRPEVEVVDGRYASVHVVQSAPPDYPTLRPHRIGVSVYSGGSRRQLSMMDLDPVKDHGRTVVPELAGVDAGDLLLLNDGDLTYAKIRFDPSNRANLPAVLPSLTDPLARALVWASMVDAVRDGEAPAADFVALFEAGLPAETEVTVVKDLVRLAVSRPSEAWSPVGGMVDRFLPSAQLADARTRIARACRLAMESAPPGSGLRLVAARSFASAAGTADVAELRGWLDGTRGPAGVAIDVEMRWTVLTRLVVLGEAGEAEIDALAAQDRTANGAEHAARCRAALPDAHAKQRAWQIIMDSDALSGRLIGATAEGFWQPDHTEVTQSYVERYFAEAPAMAARRTPWVVITVAEAAYPRFAVDPSTIALSEGLIARTDVSPGLRRAVVDFSDELRRALVGRTLEVTMTDRDGV